MASTGGPPAQQELPKKENDLFRSMAKFYETKQYKKALKAADQILKKFPAHSRTLGMKGLVVGTMGKPDEGIPFIKDGLKANMKCSVCWHCFGLLYRNDKKYADALKCYKQAMRLDEENQTIVRDTSTLQVHMRDYEGYAETRRQILTKRSDYKPNWLAFAVAKYLSGDVEGAMNIIDTYNGVNPDRSKDHEESELVMFKNDLLREQGKLAEALVHLDEGKKYVVDLLGWRVQRAEILLLLGRHAEALESWKALLVDYNGENYTYHRAWQCCLLELDTATVQQMLELKACELPSSALELTDAQRSTLKTAYAALQEELPRSRTTRRIPLTFLVNDELEAALTQYMHRALRTGVPALGADLSALFTAREGNSNLLKRSKEPLVVKDHPHFQMILRLTENMHQSLTTTQRFPGAAPESPTEPPTTVLWCLFLKAQLEEFRGDYEAALALIDQCIEHTPTAVDMYERRARLLRKSGDVAGAAEQMDAARKLDLADRYINNKATKYLLRAGHLEQAMSTIALFTRYDGNPDFNLKEMQVWWVETEYGESALKQKKYGPALKRLLAVEQHFNDYIDDMFDFHHYCMRRSTLRSYVACLSMTNGVKQHHSFQRAACSAIRCFIELHDNPLKQGAEEEVDYSKLSAAEKKKEKAKARKAAAKKAAAEEQKRKLEEEEKKAAEAAAEEAGDDKKKKAPSRPIPVDDDPNGDKLLEKDPLEEAQRLMSSMNEFAPNEVSTRVLAYDLAVRRKKPLQALQAVIGGRRLSSTDPEVFFRFLQFSIALSNTRSEPISNSSVEKAKETISELKEGPAKAAFDAEVQILFQAPPAQLLADHYAICEVRDSVKNMLGFAKGMVLLNPTEAQKLKAAILLVEGGLNKRDCTVTACEATHDFLLNELKDEANASAWFKLCSQRFPKSRTFGTPTAVLVTGPVENTTSGEITSGDC